MPKRLAGLTALALAAIPVHVSPGPLGTVSTVPAAPSEAAASPIPPQLERLPLGGVDAASLTAASALSPARQRQRLQDDGVAAEALDERPEVLTAPATAGPFDAVGFTWRRERGPTTVAVWVRVREAGTWSAWRLLPPSDVEPDEGSADSRAGSARAASEPLLTSGADGLQVRIDSAGGRLGDVHAELIDAGRSPADGRAIPAAAPNALPSGTPPRPYIISRAQWGADESLRDGAPAYAASVKVGVIHHTATTNSYTPAGAYAQIRSIYAYHTLSLGWSDIAYNVLVDRYGQIFEGRFGGVERPVISAATGGFNQFTFSVSALGNFAEAAPSPQLLESITQVMAWKLAISYVDPMGTSQLTSAGSATSRYPPGRVVTVPNIIGHRDANVTGCPGSLYGYLTAFRHNVRARILAGLVQPAIRTTPRTPGANGSVRVTSGLLYGGAWAVMAYRPNGSLANYYVGTGQSIDVRWPMADRAGAPVPEGTYRIVIHSNQNGRSAHPFSGSASTSSFIGNFETVVLHPDGPVASGWASVSNGDTATVALTVDGANPVRVTADDNRPDVGRAHPELGPFRGFSAPLSMSVGTRLVCASGERAGLLSRPLGCRWFNNPRHEPIGNVDRAIPLHGGVRLYGWAIDRDTVDPIGVRIYVDGRHAGDVGALALRPDVRAVYPVYGASHGFDVAVNTGPGVHQVCVNGLNVGAGGREGTLRCVRTASTSGPPIGHFDSFQVGANVLTVSGWSFDPDTTAAIQVSVYVDGVFSGRLTANWPRPDVAAYFPFMGSAHGFHGSVRASTVGRHTVCVYGIGAGGPPNPLLGCRAFG